MGVPKHPQDIPQVNTGAKAASCGDMTLHSVLDLLCKHSCGLLNNRHLKYLL